jgi:hypothetical protein
MKKNEAPIQKVTQVIAQREALIQEITKQNSNSDSEFD